MSLQASRTRRFKRLRWRIHQHLGIPETIFLRPSHAQLVNALGERPATEYETLEQEFWADPDPGQMTAADALAFTLAEVMEASLPGIKRGCVIDRDCGDDRCCNPAHAWCKTAEEYMAGLG